MAYKVSVDSVDQTKKLTLDGIREQLEAIQDAFQDLEEQYAQLVADDPENAAIYRKVRDEKVEALNDARKALRKSLKKNKPKVTFTKV